MAENNATIVSVFPLTIEERKPGLVPGYYKIPAAKKGDFEILVIGPAKFPVYMDETRGSLKVPVMAEEVARSIVEDYIPTHLGYGDGVGPGLFWVPGALDKNKVKIIHSDKLKLAEQSQLLWFRELVKIGDDLWSTLHKHIAISDIQRIAATSLGLEREWIIKADFDNISVCPACGKEVMKTVAVCAQCGCILDEEKYNKLKFVKAR